jgi:outer membrane protein W
MKLLLALLLAFPLYAADVEGRIGHVITRMTGQSEFDGGTLDLLTSRGFAASAEVFFSPRVSTQLAATFINPVAILNPGDIDLNTIGMDIWSASARWHFTPAARFSPFAGGGVAFVSFGNLEQRFADDIEMEVGEETAFFVEGGVRYRFRPRLFFDLTLSYMPLEGEVEVIRNARPDVVLPERVQFDPVTLSGGASWRF